MNYFYGFLNCDILFFFVMTQVTTIHHTQPSVTLRLSENSSSQSNVIEFIHGGGWLLENILNDQECEEIMQDCEEHPSEVQYGLSYCTKACFDDNKMALRIQDRIKQVMLAHTTHGIQESLRYGVNVMGNGIDVDDRSW